MEKTRKVQSWTCEKIKVLEFSEKNKVRKILEFQNFGESRERRETRDKKAEILFFIYLFVSE